jgi:hypothetical protein
MVCKNREKVDFRGGKYWESPAEAWRTVLTKRRADGKGNYREGRGVRWAGESGAAGFEEVTRAANSLQEAGIFRIGFDFFAKAADTDVHATRGDEMLAAPDSGEEFLSGENTARVGSELIEKPEFE